MTSSLALCPSPLPCHARPPPLPVLAAVAIMGDKLTPINGVGLGIVICGVLLFNYHKYKWVPRGWEGTAAVGSGIQPALPCYGRAKPKLVATVSCWHLGFWSAAWRGCDLRHRTWAAAYRTGAARLVPPPAVQCLSSSPPYPYPQA